jgi:DNA-binding transcriptional LysR family regulator
VRLLHRTTRSVTLTAEGQRFYSEIGPLLAQIDDAVAFASGSSAIVRGHLRVNVDPFCSSLLLAPSLGRFLEKYPELTLELLTRTELGNMLAEGIDIAVRFGPQPSSSLVARKLLDTRILTVAAPAYLEKHGRPAKPADLTSTTASSFAIH